MANNPNDRTSLKGRVAAEKAAELKLAKQKTAAAWTIAKTMLPDAPPAEQLKFAKTLMANSVVALKNAVRQTAVNAHWSRVAEQFASVHKVDMNDLLEDPSILTKETNAVNSELKGEAKNAATKVADDRKDAGPQPSEYPDPKRDEPTELDGSNAGKGRPESWTEGPGKEAAVKTTKIACDDKCDGNCEHKKEASAKVAEEGAPVEAQTDAADAEADATQAETDAADASTDATEAETDTEIAPEEAGEAGEQDTFDPEVTNLEEAASDLEADVNRIQEAIADLSEEPGDLTFGDEGADETEGEGDFDPFASNDETQDIPDDNGEELNFDDIFNQDNMSDKVSSLNDEDAVVDIEFNDGDDFFAPSDPSELESVLEQEEDVTSPADMFRVDDADNDPLARILASSKFAAEEGVVEPGELDKFFETNLSGDDRDSETDHDGTIMEDVYNAIKQPTRDDHRDTHPNLKDGKTAKTPAPQPGIRKLKPSAGKTANTQNVNLASLLFTDEADYL